MHQKTHDDCDVETKEEKEIECEKLSSHIRPQRGETCVYVCTRCGLGVARVCMHSLFRLHSTGVRAF